MLFCCENNLYAMGTALAQSDPRPISRCKASVYGMPAWPVDGMDVVAVQDAAGGPSLHVATARSRLPGAAHVPVPGPLDV